jgi:hypothetical protein
LIGQLFLLIEVILRLTKLWDGFTLYVDAVKEKERVARDQARDGAVDKQKGAQSEDEFDKAQDDIARNHP